jgi:hypothetical protein
MASGTCQQVSTAFGSYPELPSFAQRWEEKGSGEEKGPDPVFSDPVFSVFLCPIFSVKLALSELPSGTLALNEETLDHYGDIALVKNADQILKGLPGWKTGSPTP